MVKNITQIKRGMMINVNVRCKDLKEHHVCGKDVDPTTYTCENV